MKGYKATDRNMCCQGFQYELGKTYKTKGKLEICKNGFHFCEKLIVIDVYYDLSTSRVFEVKAKGKIKSDRIKSDRIKSDRIKSDRIKSCTNEIEFVRELSKEEIIKLANKSVNDKNAYIRMTLAKSKLASSETLNTLSKDAMCYIREGVASNPKTSTKLLGILSHDEEWVVRYAVAENKHVSKKVLEKLSKDEKCFVKNSVASNSNTSKRVLKYLSQDEDWFIRYLVTVNPNTSKEVLKILSCDDIVKIQMAAKNTLEMKETNL